ncbi:MAG: hypothetical protein K0R05_4074 [Anaerocolumna sp.]|jgi:hypothetical protein|nr:hypothetical protein [Anaerocolumna sp.]
MEINQSVITQELQKLINRGFTNAETCSVKIRDIDIKKSDKDEIIQNIADAVNQCYHDVLSDIDLTIFVKISPNDTITPDIYRRMLGRYGITKDSYLGLAYVKEHQLYRLILKNGMRYDMGFEFIEDETAAVITPDEASLGCFEEDNSTDWPLENADRFWFVQIQALAKLYRDDYLIADHLANMNINDTLALQMMLRDKEYKTNFHRYGYRDTLQYLQNQDNKCPYAKYDEGFNKIAEKLHQASIAFDQLAIQMNPKYTVRKEDYFEIWKCYDRGMFRKSDDKTE